MKYVALRNHKKTCLKKENKLKYQNERNNVPLSARHNDSPSEEEPPEIEGGVSSPILLSIPLSSVVSPVVVQEIPVIYEIGVPFDQF